MTIRVFAPAKINLTLHVTGQRDDGYHLLDSLVCFADVGDWVSVEASDELKLDITGPFADDLSAEADNLVLRAAKLLGGGKPAKISLKKNLPVSSGIGGGSADAAAAVRALSQLWGCDLPGHSAVLALGADVPVCLMDQPARMRGIGDKLTGVSNLPQFHGVLVNPSVSISTPLVFKGLGVKNNAPLTGIPTESSADIWLDWLKLQRNDLQVPAIQLAPAIAEIIEVLDKQTGCEMARMSGSGATCFGLFKDEATAKQAALTILSDNPDWWVKECRLNHPGDDIIS